MSLIELRKKIIKKEANLAVIGLGYVGLPVAVLFANAGFKVMGVEIKLDRTLKINKGICPIEGEEPELEDLLSNVVAKGYLQATTSYDDIKDSDVILVAVETPVDDHNIPQYSALRAVISALGPVMKDNVLVIIESTIAPGTMSELVLPLLELHSGKNINREFFLGNCPERVMPGMLIQNLKNVSRVVGGYTPETAEIMIELYKNVVQADLDPADCITAELVKTVENSYRDVQIAFANEVALICEAVGGDVWKVRELVNKSPMRQMHFPGSGVGGHCIPKDPWLLAYSVKDKNIPLRLIPASRAINDSMPLHILELLEKGMSALGCKLSNSRVLILGYSYLEDSDDTRNSPSRILIDRLRELGSEVIVHDPYINEYKGDVRTLANDVDAIIVMVAHSEYKVIELQEIRSKMRTPLLIDGRSVFTERQIKESGVICIKLGQGPISLVNNYV